MTDIILTSLALGFLGGLWVAILASELGWFATAVARSEKLSQAASTLSEAGREKIRAKVEDTTRKLRRELGR